MPDAMNALTAESRSTENGRRKDKSFPREISAEREGCDLWEVPHAWILDSYLESSRNDEESQTKWSRQVQEVLSDSLSPEETLVYSFSRGSDGRMKWVLGLQGGDRESWQSMGLVLCSLGQNFTFRERGAHPTFDGSTWMELYPRTESIPVGAAALGFGSGGNESGIDDRIEVPALRWDMRLQRLPHLLAECPDLQAVEVAVKLIADSDGSERIRKRLESAARQRSNPAATSRFESWRENVSKGRIYELRCRVSLSETASPESWANVLGRELFRSDAELLPESATRTSRDASRLFGGEDLPLLIPTFDLLRESGVRRRYTRLLPTLPSEGVVAGRVEGKLLRLPEEGRDRHTYIVGATGTGKSTLLFNLIQQDLERGEGVILLDPHGDLCEQVFYAVPEGRADSVILLDPSDTGIVPGFNPLALPDDRFRDLRSSYITGEFIRLFQQLWENSDAFGPMFELYFRNALLLLMRNGKGARYTLADFPRVFTDRDFRQKLLKDVEVPAVKEFWQNMAEKASGEPSLQNVAPYIVSKLDCFINGGFLSKVVSGSDTTLRFDEIMDSRGILLVNLNKGLIGGRESRLLGMLLMMQIFSAALGRSTKPEHQRVPCRLYVDEFQNFVSDGMAEMLSEARKFGLRLTLANQTLQQLSTGRGPGGILDSVLGNVGNFMSFRLGVRESAVLEPFTRPITAAQMQRLPNFHAFARILDGSGPIEPVVMETLKKRG